MANIQSFKDEEMFQELPIDNRFSDSLLYCSYYVNQLWKEHDMEKYPFISIHETMVHVIFKGTVEDAQMVADYINMMRDNNVLQ